jgi:hypothetical protein
MPNIQHGDVVFGADLATVDAWAADLVDTVVKPVRTTRAAAVGCQSAR